MNFFSGQSLVSSSGQPVLANHALQSKPVLALYFSAHWCSPCRQFTPLLKRAYEQAAPAKVGVVFVSSDRTRADQLAYMRESHGPWPAVEAGSALVAQLSQHYGVRGIPALIVVNAADGTVIARDGRQDVMSLGAGAFAQWESMAPAAIDTGIVDMLDDNPDELKRNACQILIKLLGNVIREPNNIKYRSIRLSNPKIESQLLAANGAFETLFSVGFEENNDSLILPLSVSTHTLSVFKEAIEAILSKSSNSSASSSSSAAAPSTSASASASSAVSASQASSSTAVSSDLATNPNEASFLAKLEAERQHVLSYEDPTAQVEALKVIPLELLESKAKAKFDALKANDVPVADAVVRDLLLLELLDWFKTDFFKWVDEPECGQCGGKTSHKGYLVPTEEEQRDGAARVEGYTCPSCPPPQSDVRFPRYHRQPSKLLHPSCRRGRCGEFANCFALCLRALGFDTRHVLDFTDHVWVEVYSEAERRWLHADPCENACDKPLVYEAGWGKRLTYVIAASKDEVQDVSWRYSADQEALKQRRTLVSEQWLNKALLKLTEKCQQGYEEREKKRLVERRLLELVELMTPKKKSSKEELLGRQSGSSAWRLARGEMGLGLEDVPKTTWRLTEKEKEAMLFQLEYDVVKDEYRRRQGEEVVLVKGWTNGVGECEDVIRKVEHDWGQVYLARREGASKSSVSWEIDLEDTDLSVKSIELSVNSTTYENGRVIWQLCGGSVCLLPSSGSTLKSDGLAGAKHLGLTAVLSGGRGDVAWQHTQLFRTHRDEGEENKEPKFKIVLKLQKD